MTPTMIRGEITIARNANAYPGAPARTARQGYAIVHRADYAVMGGPFATAADAERARRAFAPSAAIVACSIRG